MAVLRVERTHTQKWRHQVDHLFAHCWHWLILLIWCKCLTNFYISVSAFPSSCIKPNCCCLTTKGLKEKWRVCFAYVSNNRCKNVTRNDVCVYSPSQTTTHTHAHHASWAVTFYSWHPSWYVALSGLPLCKVNVLADKYELYMVTCVDLSSCACVCVCGLNRRVRSQPFLNGNSCLLP